MNLSPLQRHYLARLQYRRALIGGAGQNDKRVIQALRRKGLVVDVWSPLSGSIFLELTPAGAYHATLAMLDGCHRRMDLWGTPEAA